MMSDSQFEFAGKKEDAYSSDDDDYPRKNTTQQNGDDLNETDSRYKYDSEFSDDEPTRRDKDNSADGGGKHSNKKNGYNAERGDSKHNRSGSSYSSLSDRNTSKYSRKDSYESSEDKDTDDDDKEVSPPKQENNSKKTQNTNNAKNHKSPNQSNKMQQVQAQRRAVSQPQRKGVGRGRGRGRGVAAQTRVTEDRGVVVNRVLSANRNKSRALLNVIHDLQHQIETLSVENRDLKRAARLQDREIRKLDNAEAELPSLLKKHSSEMHALQEKFKKQKESGDKAKKDLKKSENELFKTKEKLRKYEDMAKEKNLGERNTLAKKLQDLETTIEEKDKKISELTRAVSLHEKVRARELKEKNEKYKKAVDEMKRLEEEQKELLRRLRDKEKALEVTNIYSHRLQRRGSKDSEYTLFAPDDPVPAVIRRHQEEQGSVYAESVMQAFIAEKKSATSKNTRQRMVTYDNEKDSPASSPRRADVKESPRQQEKPQVRTLVSESRKMEIEKDREVEEIEDEDFFYNGSKPSEEEERLEEIDRKLTEMRRREEQERVDEEVRRQEAERELEQRIARIEQERKRQEAEKAAKEEQERMRREEQEMKLLNEMWQQKEKEEKELEAMKQRQKEDEEFNNKKEQMFEKRKKKELLLAKMQAIDQGENPNRVTEENSYIYQPKRDAEKPKKKPIFLESDKESRFKREGDFLSHEPLDFSGNAKIPAARGENTNDHIISTKSERRSSYEFKQTDENLHKGLPAHSEEDSPVTKRRNTKDRDDIYFGSSSGRGRRGLSNDTLNHHSTNGNVSTGNKKGHEDNGLITSYSPTGFDSPRSRNTKVSNKNNDSPFSLFDDPFKSTTENKYKNNIAFSSDEEDDDVATAYQPSNNRRKFTGPKPVQHKRSSLKSEPFGADDDLEEMILA